MPEKVERFKLSKEQISFGKEFKQLLKIQKALLGNLQGHMSVAKTLRGQLEELEGVMGQTVQQAPAPTVQDLEGQEVPA